MFWHSFLPPNPDLCPDKEKELCYAVNGWKEGLLDQTQRERSEKKDFQNATAPSALKEIWPSPHLSRSSEFDCIVEKLYIGVLLYT